MNQASALAGVFFYASGCHNGSRSFFIKKVSYLFVQTSSSPPYKIKCFFLEISRNFVVVNLVNEPDPWASLCIWYENRGVLGIQSRTSLIFRSAWPCVCPFLYGSAPPVSTRIFSFSDES